ncbi:DnaD domain protein [Lysinibacillus sp. Bpr_S20]|uniref:DnaD domain-containing protein n=1 Tax=Lysinibacillus sp. Bpr_S20 TaxID=2933964 RepID=UPI0020124CF7|nr:DnaD domain protein [Lysinibacillus sp. Bpr_S20]MCL1701592.1 DnaD domain protein [Lysinibacillus sp. Bpr_S20]
MESRSIVRVEKNKDYTVINNTSIQDTRLSWKAKAIHVFMLSKPDNWTFYNEEMQQWAKDGKDSFTAGLRELQKYGYVKKERRRIEGGKFDYVTIVYEVPYMDLPHTENPSTEEPHTGKPSTDKPLTENPQLLSTNIPSTDSLSTKSLNDDDKGPAYATSEKQTAPPTQNAFAFYEQNHFGALGSFIMDKIDAWINDMSEPIVIHAMKKAVVNGKTNWGYVEKILKDWWSKKLFTIEAIEAEDLRWKDQRIKATQQQNRPQRTYQPKRREEVVPEWFKNRNNNSAPEPEEQTIPTEQVDFEAERQKILAMLDRGHKDCEQTQKNS